MKNVSLKIISPQFELLGVINDYESLQFIRRFYTVGEFELHININKAYTDVLIKNNLILLGTSFNKVGIIMHRELEQDDNGNDTLTVKGSTLKGIMSRRLIMPPVNGDGYDNESGAIETILKNFANNNVVNPTDAARKIPQVVIAADQKRGKQDSWRSRLEVLSDKLAEIGEYAQLGWDVVLDIVNKHWVFDVIEGKNLTTGQDSLPPVIFSTDFNNILTPHFTQSLLGTANVGYAGGKGEETDRLIQKIGNTSGLERIESFLDCSNAEDVTELLNLGQQKLDELKEIKTFELSIIPDNSFIYEEDYDLGDFVTTQSKKWNITMDAQIVEVKEIYEVDGFKLEVTFGTNIPTPLTKIKQLLQRPMIEKSTLTANDIPQKTSQLQNDAGFITAADIPKVNTYTHNQITASAIWDVKHNLNRYPTSVTITDSAGNVVLGDIKNISVNELTISFTAPFSGNAYLS